MDKSRRNYGLRKGMMWSSKVESIILVDNIVGEITVDAMKYYL